MKALMLSGGLGTRLRPLTHTSAKQLLPVANRPVLFYGLEAVARAGIRDVGIVVGDTAAEVERAVGDGGRFGLDVGYVRQELPLGLAHAVMVAGDFLGDDDFLVYLGDNYIEEGVGGLVADFLEGRPSAQVLVGTVDDPRSYGVAEVDGSARVLRLVEKPARPRSDLALVGAYVFGPAVHKAVRAIPPSARGELEITDAIQWLIDAGESVDARTVTGFWGDAGSVEGILEINRALLERITPYLDGSVDPASLDGSVDPASLDGSVDPASLDGSVDPASELVGPVSIGPGTRIEGSRIVGPAVVGAGVRITDSWVGPHVSIADGCRISASRITSSIVLAGARIVGVWGIDSSIVGRDAQVLPGASGLHRLVLGDHCQARISWR